MWHAGERFTLSNCRPCLTFPLWNGRRFKLGATTFCHTHSTSTLYPTLYIDTVHSILPLHTVYEMVYTPYVCSIFQILFSVLYTRHFLCVLFTLHSLHTILCTSHTTLYTLHSALCTLYYILFPMFYPLSTPSILYIFRSIIFRIHAMNGL